MRIGKKRLLAILQAAALILSGCKGAAPAADQDTAIELWVYQIGDFSDPDTVESFIAGFESRNPGIKVSVDYLDYATGDDQVQAAIDAGTAPDVIMEGPERLVANWGAKGVMADIGSLWTPEARADIDAVSPVIAAACRDREGTYYEYPLCVNAHCMAINYEMFAKAGALGDIDPDSRTWTTDQFRDACRRLADSGLCEAPGVVYCGGQGGDQGTRALVTNLYGAQFTNADHTAYTVNSAAGVRALTELVGMAKQGTFSFNAGIQASDELQMFAEGRIAMTLAWNSSNEKNYAEDVGFTPYTMAFPTAAGSPQLCTGIWGFGLFDNGDPERIAAGRQLISFLCDDPDQGAQSVLATRCFPARRSIGNPYAGTPDEQRMAAYQKMLGYVGDYYSVTPGWSAQRTAWWTMLQQVFYGADPQSAADQYVKIADDAISNEAK